MGAEKLFGFSERICRLELPLVCYSTEIERGYEDCLCVSSYPACLSQRLQPVSLRESARKLDSVIAWDGMIMVDLWRAALRTRSDGGYSVTVIQNLGGGGKGLQNQRQPALNFWYQGHLWLNVSVK